MGSEKKGRCSFCPRNNISVRNIRSGDEISLDVLEYKISHGAKLRICLTCAKENRKKLEEQRQKEALRNVGVVGGEVNTDGDYDVHMDCGVIEGMLLKDHDGI